MDELREAARNHLSTALSKATQVMMVRGEGPYVYDEDGRRYLDYVSGIAVNSLGHCHPRIVAAIKRQAETLIHGSFNLGYYPTAVRLAARLAEVTPEGLDVFFFSNSGAEAVEGVLKLARHKTRRVGIIAFRGAFHGRTMGALSVTSSTVGYRAGYLPYLPSVFYAPYPYCYRCPYRAEPDDCELDCLKEIERMFSYIVSPDDVACILIEPVQGEGGYIVPPARYLKALRELATERGVLLAFDEVQSGFGRTGEMFASQHFGVTPDIMAVGKAIAAGLPLSAVASTNEIMKDWGPGAHGTTFGANPVACAAALEALDVFQDEHILDNCRRQGGYLKSRLQELQSKYPVIGDVRGIGLMVAVEVVEPDGSPDPESAKAINKHCLEHRLLFFVCGTFKNCIRFMPPLNVTREVLDEGLEIFEGALRSLA